MLNAAAAAAPQGGYFTRIDSGRVMCRGGNPPNLLPRMLGGRSNPLRQQRSPFISRLPPTGGAFSMGVWIVRTFLIAASLIALSSVTAFARFEPAHATLVNPTK